MFIDPKLTARERWELRILHKKIIDASEEFSKALHELNLQMEQTASVVWGLSPIIEAMPTIKSTVGNGGEVK